MYAKNQVFHFLVASDPHLPILPRLEGGAPLKLIVIQCKILSLFILLLKLACSFRVVNLPLNIILILLFSYSFNAIYGRQILFYIKSNLLIFFNSLFFMNHIFDIFLLFFNYLFDFRIV